MADADPEKTEKNDKESEEKEGSAAQESEASATKPDTKVEVSVFTKPS